MRRSTLSALVLLAGIAPSSPAHAQSLPADTVRAAAVVADTVRAASAADDSRRVAAERDLIGREARVHVAADSLRDLRWQRQWRQQQVWGGAATGATAGAVAGLLVSALTCEARAACVWVGTLGSAVVLGALGAEMGRRMPPPLERPRPFDPSDPRQMALLGASLGADIGRRISGENGHWAPLAAGTAVGGVAGYLLARYGYDPGRRRPNGEAGARRRAAFVVAPGMAGYVQRF